MNTTIKISEQFYSDLHLLLRLDLISSSTYNNVINNISSYKQKTNLEETAKQRYEESYECFKSLVDKIQVRKYRIKENIYDNYFFGEINLDSGASFFTENLIREFVETSLSDSILLKKDSVFEVFILPIELKSVYSSSDDNFYRSEGDDSEFQISIEDTELVLEDFKNLDLLELLSERTVTEEELRSLYDEDYLQTYDEGFIDQYISEKTAG